MDLLKSVQGHKQRPDQALTRSLRPLHPRKLLQIRASAHHGPPQQPKEEIMPNQCDPAHAQSQGPSGSPSSEACASAAFCCCCTSSATSSNIPAKPHSQPPRALPSRHGTESRLTLI